MGTSKLCVACVYCSTPCQLIGNFKIDLRIQMTIGSQGRLYFFCSGRFLINRGFSSILISREAWESLVHEF